MAAEKRSQLIVRLDARELEGLRRRAAWYKKSLADMVRDCLRAGLPQVLASYEEKRRAEDLEADRFAAWEGPEAAADNEAWAGREAPGGETRPNGEDNGLL